MALRRPTASPLAGLLATLLATLLAAGSAAAETLEVGSGKPFATPCAAIAVAAPGDEIEVDAAGSYDGDVCAWSTNGLTIRGVGGRAKIDAAGNDAQGKGIFVVYGHDTTIENMELSGAEVADHNGAGIRQHGRNLTVRNCYFHHNENGILAGSDPESSILVEGSEFAHNGYEDGKAHNIYINHVGAFTLRHSYSHHAKIGHLVKSRAAKNYILYNRLTDETGTASYELDLPNGGTSLVIGNLFQQSATTDNPSILSYRAEGAHADNPGDDLYVVNNTFVNDKATGTFVRVQDGVATPALVRNNVFVGAGAPVTQAGALQETNFAGDPNFLDSAAYDYRLSEGSPCVDAGSDPSIGGGRSLVPTMQYIHPADAEPRALIGAIDIGAFELGSAASTGGGGMGSTDPTASGGAGAVPPAAGSGAASTGASAVSGASGAAANEAEAGCGCRAPQPAPARGASLVVLAALAAFARRRPRGRRALC